MPAPTYTMTIRVYYEDTDAGGVVYYANYLRYLERARTELMRCCGVDVPALAARGVLFVIVHAELDYRRPAVLGDELAIHTAVGDMKRASLRFDYTIRRAATGEDLVTASTTAACVNAERRVIRLPDEVFRKLGGD